MMRDPMRARASLLLPQDRELQFVFCASAEMANDGEVKSLINAMQSAVPSRPRRHPAPWRCAHAPILARGVV